MYVLHARALLTCIRHFFLWLCIGHIVPLNLALNRTRHNWMLANSSSSGTNAKCRDLFVYDILPPFSPPFDSILYFPHLIHYIKAMCYITNITQTINIRKGFL